MSRKQVRTLFPVSSDYVLQHIIGEGPDYQDWYAIHSQVTESIRRVRLYVVRENATPDERQTNHRVALRGLGHPLFGESAKFAASLFQILG